MISNSKASVFLHWKFLMFHNWLIYLLLIIWIVFFLTPCYYARNTLTIPQRAPFYFSVLYNSLILIIIYQNSCQYLKYQYYHVEIYRLSLYFIDICIIFISILISLHNFFLDYYNILYLKIFWICPTGQLLICDSLQNRLLKNV